MSKRGKISQKSRKIQLQNRLKKKQAVSEVEEKVLVDVVRVAERTHEKKLTFKDRNGILYKVVDIAKGQAPHGYQIIETKRGKLFAVEVISPLGKNMGHEKLIRPTSLVRITETTQFKAKHGPKRGGTRTSGPKRFDL